jgi:hypothetical protein
MKAMGMLLKAGANVDAAIKVGKNGRNSMRRRQSDTSVREGSMRNGGILTLL